MTEQLLPRTKEFGMRVIRLVEALPKTRAGNLVAGQLLRAATSVGANYRAARRARSTAEFCSKLGIVEEEADESVYWLEMIMEVPLLPKARVTNLHREGEEILKMVVASIRTAKAKPKQGKPS